MRAVSRFESDLLHILHAALGRAPVESVLPRVFARSPRPACLARDAVELVQDALANGCVDQLARRGGWRPGRHLRGEQVAAGRLWQRTPPEELGLVFSRHALGFLIWLTADHPADRPLRWQPPDGELTVGDRLLLFFAYEALRPTGAGPALREARPYAGHALCGLAFPDDFAHNQMEFTPVLTPWIAGVGACILEALQPWLAERWLAVERRKGQEADPHVMRLLGRTQERILGALLPALAAAGRRDLARFLLQAAAGLLRGEPRARDWTGALDLRRLRLAARLEVFRAALTLLEHLERLRDWERQARTIGYFDEGYAAAQLWKAEWDRWDGEGLIARARVVRRELEPLGPGPIESRDQP